MTVLDLGNNIAPTLMLAAASRTSTTLSAAVDVTDVTWGAIIISLGDMHATETVTFQVQHSDASGGTYAAAKKLGTTTDADTSAFTNSSDNTLHIIRVDCRNLDGFVKVNATHSGSNAQIYAVNFIAMPNYTGDATAPAVSV